MEMKIEFDSNCSQSKMLPYKELLVLGVAPILERIGESFSDVKWIIYDPQSIQFPKKIADQICIIDQKMLKPSTINPTLIQKDGKYYGFCDIEEKTIYISIKTIESKPIPQSLAVSKQPFQQKSLSLFTRVIIDELAHIATGKNHDSKEYNDIHKSYAQKCIGL